MNQHIPPKREERKWPYWYGLINGEAKRPSAVLLSFDEEVISAAYWAYNRSAVYSYVVVPQ